MKLLYINAMGARQKTPLGGIFVTQRIKALQRLGVDVVPISIYIEYTTFVQKILKFLGNLNMGKPVSVQDGVLYDIYSVKYSLREVLLENIFGNIYKNKIVKELNECFKKHRNIELIHLHWFWPVGQAVLDFSRDKGIPYVVTCHGSDINVLMANAKHRESFIEILESAKRVEFVSNALMETACNMGYTGYNGIVVHNGINTEIFQKALKEKSTKKRIGYVGNMVCVKGADLLPKIFNKIYEKIEDIEFVVVGDGVLCNDIKMQMSELPVRFTGQLSQQQLAEEYKNMDILVVPSRVEGYSCVIKEAQACGVIPIANNVGGIKEAMGEYGVLIDAECEDDMVDKMVKQINRILKDDSVIDKNIMAKEAAKCSWEQRQKLCVEYYKDIIEK